LNRDTVERSRASLRISTWQIYDQHGENHAVRLFVVRPQKCRRVLQGEYTEVSCRVAGSHPDAGEESERVVFGVGGNIGEEPDREERISGGGIC
jgi:hypothetical protein